MERLPGTPRKSSKVRIMPPRRQAPTLDRVRAEEDREVLEAMVADEAGDRHTRTRAKVILALLRGESLNEAAASAGLGVATARKKITAFNEGGWKALITVQAPRGGDFLARYDNGFWAERFVLTFLNQSPTCRAVSYGTSRSEPFTDMQTFRNYMETEFLLQAWSSAGGSGPTSCSFRARSSAPGPATTPGTRTSNTGITQTASRS